MKFEPGPGAIIRHYRLEKKLSLRSLAAKLGVSAAYLCDTELGRRNAQAFITKALKILGHDFQFSHCQECNGRGVIFEARKGGKP